MPNEISNALGTARQFAPKPDATYQGRYKDIGVSQVHPTQSSWTTLADNISKLNNALQSYAVSHEKYLDSTGLDKAQDMIKSKSPEDIEKLNLIDGAQSEGVLDVGSNPYFKAYAEKLRGNFLSARLKQNYDDEYANTPAKSAEEELNRYNEYVQNYRDSLLEKAPPSNLEAFDRGFYENSLTNATNLVGAYNKKKNEEYVVNTMSDITNELGDIIDEAPELLKDNHSFTERVREAFNATRLMSVPAQYRQKLVNDFTNQCVEAGIFPFERLSQMMENVVVQTDMAGNTKTIADMVDINALKDINMAYELKYDRKQVDDWVKQYGDTKQADKFEEETEALKYTNPREYKKRSLAMPQIHQAQENKKKEEEALKRARIAAANRSAGSGSNSSKIADTDAINQTIGAWLNGDTIVGGYGTIRNMKFDEGAFTSCVMNQLQYMASNGYYAGCTKLMSMPQVNSIKADLASQFGSSLAGVHLDDNGNAVYDDNVKYLVEWVNKDPAGAMYLFSGSNSNEALIISGLSATMGGIDNAMKGYAVWNSKSSDERKNAIGLMQKYYDAGGVENIWDGSTDATISITNSPYLKTTWETLSAINYFSGASSIEDAQNLAGATIVRNTWYFRGGAFPKYLTQNITGTGTHDGYYFSMSLYQLAGAPKDFTVNYDWSGQRFTLTNLDTGSIQSFSASHVREVAGQIAEQKGKEQAQKHYEDTQLTAEDISNYKTSQALEAPDSNYVGGEDPIAAGWQKIKSVVGSLFS